MMAASLISEQELRWKCRRGMLELDLLLNRYLDHHYCSLDSAAADKLIALLDYPDQVLHDLLVSNLPPSDPAMTEIITCIRCSRSK